jgi:hypothetical protein
MRMNGFIGRGRLILAAAAVAVATTFVGSAGAAPGDLLRTVQPDLSGTFCSAPRPPGNAVGLAFRGSKLWVNCLFFGGAVGVDPYTGAQLALLPLLAQSQSISWDPGRGVFWRCAVSGTHLDTIPPYQLQLFHSCFSDAYDPVDDTIWIVGADGFSHWLSTFSGGTGTQIGGGSPPFPPDPACSPTFGLAVALDTLYVSASCRVYAVPKTLDSVSVALPDTHASGDLACDDVTFGGKTALWTLDQLTRTLRAYELPQASCAPRPNRPPIARR